MKDYKTTKELVDGIIQANETRVRCCCINISLGGEQELPSEEEMAFGLSYLERARTATRLTFIVSHCCPTAVCSVFSHGVYKPDKAHIGTSMLLQNTVKFSKWFFGHYHK
jgi:hypothetical protein